MQWYQYDGGESAGHRGHGVQAVVPGLQCSSPQDRLRPLRQCVCVCVCVCVGVCVGGVCVHEGYL